MLTPQSDVNTKFRGQFNIWGLIAPQNDVYKKDTQLLVDSVRGLRIAMW